MGLAENNYDLPEDDFWPRFSYNKHLGRLSSPMRLKDESNRQGGGN